MHVSLPGPVAGYFTADAEGGASVAGWFTADGVVIDENRAHRGHAAIARWKTRASERYRYASAPVAVEDRGDRLVVTARVTGDFPGSPVDLRYAFTLSGNAIARLEIVP